jgi:2-keto-4-pentenoate hydratase/2-oxohepta-3-ene-1,7-dioic acid hydratase (catechol pathway)
MKIIRFLHDGQTKWGHLEDGQVRVLAQEPFENLVYSGEVISLDSGNLLSPCLPGKIVCAGKNYYDHAVEMGEGVPKEVVLFMKTPNTIANPEDLISAPDFVDRVDFEGELAIVIGKKACKIKADQVDEYIFGYTVLNDVTARKIQKGDGQWSRGKCMDGFCPMGPWIETELDPSNLALETRLNGEVKQKSNTNLLMTGIPAMLEHITACITLEVGDVVATGTPAGIGPMESGDVVEVEIEGIGVLKNKMA